MEIYLVHITERLVPKNKLQKAVSEFMENWDGKAFEAERIEDVKQQIIDRITELNNIHKRSTPIHPDFYETEKAIHLFGIQSIRIIFLKGKIIN